MARGVVSGNSRPAVAPGPLITKRRGGVVVHGCISSLVFWSYRWGSRGKSGTGRLVVVNFVSGTVLFLLVVYLQ